MDSFLQTPEWVGTALIGAVIAALGYVGKLIIEIVQGHIEKKRINQSRLIELRSFLGALRVAFEVQKKHARSLTSSIKIKHHQFEQIKGYEKVISSAYEILDKNQRELHAIIRSITENTLAPINKEVLVWLRGDTYFKAQRNELARQLSLLEAHIILWLAKYEAWIPPHPKHSLVYLADEEKHGLGFPKEIDRLIDEKTGFQWRDNKSEEGGKELSERGNGNGEEGEANERKEADAFYKP